MVDTIMVAVLEIFKRVAEARISSSTDANTVTVLIPNIKPITVMVDIEGASFVTRWSCVGSNKPNGFNIGQSKLYKVSTEQFRGVPYHLHQVESFLTVLYKGVQHTLKNLIMDAYAFYAHGGVLPHREMHTHSSKLREPKKSAFNRIQITMSELVLPDIFFNYELIQDLSVKGLPTEYMTDKLAAKALVQKVLAVPADGEHKFKDSNSRIFGKIRWSRDLSNVPSPQDIVHAAQAANGPTFDLTIKDYATIAVEGV